jgi:hypothetical protein
MSELLLDKLLEVTVLIVIVLELFALYRNMRIERRLAEHLVKTDALITELDKHLERLEDDYEKSQDSFSD